MSNDLIERLRFSNPKGIFGKDMHEAANALEAKDQRIEQLEAKLYDSENAYRWLKSELRTNAKIIGEQRDTIEQLEADLKTSQEAVAEYIDDIERLEAALENSYCELCGCAECLEREQALGEKDICDHTWSDPSINAPPVTCEKCGVAKEQALGERDEQ